MKKNFLIPIIAFAIFSSCKKEAANPESEQVASIESNVTTTAADPTMFHLKVDVTGLTFQNGCTNEDLLIISGVFSLNSHQDGTVASYNLHDFVLQAEDGTIYRGIWAGTFTLIGSESGPGTVTNTYKAIMTTAGGGNNFLLQGVFHVTVNANGELTAFIDNFTAGCQ